MTITVVREPLYRTVPDCRRSFGDLAARVGAELGLPPDDEQRVALDAIFAEVEPGIPRYRHVCMVATRQQIKTATLSIASATDMLLLGVPGAVWTAHQSKTATKAYEDLSRRLRAHDEYRDLVGFRAGRGEEAIYLLDDPAISLEYRARSGGSGRGFTTGRLTLDEALYLRAGDIGALAPTMLTRRDGQIRYGSSAGLLGSEVLRGLRNDGRDGRDPGLWYVEYGSTPRDCEQPACTHVVDTPGCALDDRELWWQSCPGLWCARVREEDVADLRRRMPPEEFAREVLGWWDDPPEEGGAAIPADDWRACLDPQSRYGGSGMALGLHLTGDRSTAYVVAVGRRSDGLAHVEILDVVAPHRVVAAIKERTDKHRCPVVLDPGSHAGSLAEPLEREGVTVEAVSVQKIAQACGMVIDAVTSKSLRHIGQPPLDAAVASAGVRTISRDAWAWSGQGIAPLSAMTLAMWGYATTQGPSAYEERGLVTL